MKKIFQSIILLLVFCNIVSIDSLAASLKKDNPSAFNKLTNGLYIFSETEEGKYQPFLLNNKGEIDPQKKGIIDYPDSVFISDDIYFAEAGFPDKINNYEQGKEENIIKLTINKFLQGIPEKNIYFLDYRVSNNQIKEFEENHKFSIAHFNKFENPEIQNSVSFKGDEFDFHEKKQTFVDIRKKEYLCIIAPKAIKSALSIPGWGVYINPGEYDFKKKGFKLDINLYTSYPNQQLGQAEILTQNISYFYKIDTTNARQFKNEEGLILILATYVPKYETIEAVYSKNGFIIGDKRNYDSFSERVWGDNIYWTFKEIKIKKLLLSIKKFEYIPPAGEQ